MQCEVVGCLCNVVDNCVDMLYILLDYLCIEVGVVILQLVFFCLQVLIYCISCEMVVQVEVKGLVFCICESQVVVSVDVGLIELILCNLVFNVICYIECGGVLVVCCQWGLQVWLEVWDIGIGIVLEQQQEIFCEFYQLGNLECDYNKGMGLGLVIVEGLVKMQGLQLMVQLWLGCGSVFWL